MQKKPTSRILCGAACLVVLALVMGWFVGQYLPGEPKAPEALPSANAVEEDTRTAAQVVPVKSSTKALLARITQGDAYLLTNDDLSALEDPESYKNELEKAGLWQITYPDISVTVKESRTVSFSSFVEWYPNYPGSLKSLKDRTMVLVTLSVANASHQTIQGSISPYRGALPMMTLNGPSIKASHDSLRAGHLIDIEAYILLNEPTPGEASTADISIEPGQEQDIIMPFVLTQADLEDPADFETLTLADYCIQIPDYTTSTLYRLWLG